MAEGEDERPPAPRGGSRRATRRAALQAIYQWLQADTEAGDLILQFQRAGYLRGCDVEYFRTLIRGVTADPDALEAAFAPYLDRAPEHLDPVERAILLLGSYELRERPEIPYRVVLDEALNLARRFGAQDGHRFINGVLDKVVRGKKGLESKDNR